MKHNYSDNDPHTNFFEKAEIPYKRSKEEVWSTMMEKRKTVPPKKTKSPKMIMYWSAAAVLILFLGVTAILRFYTITIVAPAGQHVSQILPDNSKIHLNANTNATYYPYWWVFDRTIKLEGEAYFEVTKGKSFSVISDLGTTRVLGTSFNIFARGNNYRVHCLTGKVEVKSKEGNKQILKPNQAVAISKQGDVKMIEKTKTENAISWTKNKFVFTGAPLVMVFEEMERQFDIQIEYNKNLSGKYTGNFKRGSSPEEILQVIAMPFGLKVEKIHQTKYKISQ